MLPSIGTGPVQPWLFLGGSVFLSQNMRDLVLLREEKEERIMASEYLKYLNRDVEPEGPSPELTPKEKRRNWWYYQWKTVVIICVIVIAAISMVLHNLGITEPLVDYQISYVGAVRLSDETVEALTDFFEEYGEDASGDGKVTVEVTQYVFYENTDAYDYAQMTASAAISLEADITARTSYFFLLDNPAGFVADYPILADLDGNLSADGDVSWEDKVLSLSRIMKDVPQEASGLYLARRGFYDEKHTVKYKDACDDLWEHLVSRKAAESAALPDRQG